LLKTHYQNVEFSRVNVYGGQPFSVSRIVEAVEKSPGGITNGTLKDAYTEAAVHA
jgi:hypothetical protein